MTIARAQMNRQLYQMGGMGMESLSPMKPAMESSMYNPLESNYYSGTPMMMASGGIANLVEREKYGLGSKLKKFVRNIIPNEISAIAVKAAPFVAPFNPALAAAMSGIGGFDQTGRIGSSLKNAALVYGAGQLARGIGGAGFQGNPFTGVDFSGGFTSGIGSLFSSPMGNLPFGSFSTPTTTPVTSITPTQNLIQTSSGYTGGVDLAPSELTGRTAQELQSTLVSGGGISPYDAPARSAEQLVKTYGTQTGTEPGYIDLIKKAGSFENVPLSERFNAVKDLSTKALTDIYTKPIINPKTGETTNVLDKNSLFATFAGASSYFEARKLADKAGIPESEFNEADYQRLKVQPEKEKFTDLLKPSSFGIRTTAQTGGIMNGLQQQQQEPIFPRLETLSENLGQAEETLGQPSNQSNNSPMTSLMMGPQGFAEGGLLSIQLTPVQKMAMGGEIPVRKNQGGVTELDLRAKGGYIPVGIKEKADDVPAMLSKNEFVFTADAVRGAGNGSINKGAQKMYKLMKSLEKKVKKNKKVA
jgi:hypothetical protein